MKIHQHQAGGAGDALVNHQEIVTENVHEIG